MMLIRKTKGASLVEYGLIVGLIAVTAIPAVLHLGNKTAEIFDTASAALEVVDEADSDLVISISGGDFLINGGGGNSMVTGQSRIITVRNAMTEPTDEIVAYLEDGSHFEITSNGCDGVILAPRESCAVTVRAMSNTNGNFTDDLRIFY